LRRARTPIVELFGFRFDALTQAEAETKVVALAREPGVHLVFTPNVDHVVTAHRRPDFRHAYEAATLQLADGAPVVVTAYLAGRPLPGRATGSDLLPGVCAVAAREGLRVVVCGGTPEVNEKAIGVLRARHPGFDVIGTSPPFGFDADETATRELIAWLDGAGADVVFLCVGAPRSELWLAAHRGELPDGAYVAAGAAVDFVAGTKRRAPRLLQRIGMEWLWRLAQEPGRLGRRYLLEDVRFLPLAAREILSKRRGRS
jgi:exopolysaccharide biosynthesis WecB/TagA/CpsF family protein